MAEVIEVAGADEATEETAIAEADNTEKATEANETGEAELETVASASDKSAADQRAESTAGNAEDNVESTVSSDGDVSALAATEDNVAEAEETEKPSAVKSKKQVVKGKKRTTGNAKTKASKTSAVKKKRASRKKTNANGYTPTAWEVPPRAPSEKNRDQLTDIKGVGPVLEGKLHEAGIYYFKQVALLDKDGVIELQEQIPQFPGRIKRDKWVSQAKSLHRKKYGVAAKNS